MTEDEWLASGDPALMLTFLKRKGSQRKRRLFAVECCRRVWDYASDERSRNAVVVAEQFADGLANGSRLEAAQKEAKRASQQAYDPTAWLCAFSAVKYAGDAANQYHCVVSAFEETYRQSLGREIGLRHPILQEFRKTERRKLADLLREIFGNPFRPLVVDPHSLTTSVASLSKAIYEDKAFERLPILADALEEGGCMCEEVLNHFRLTSGNHVKGCWALDVVLGKE